MTTNEKYAKKGEDPAFAECIDVAVIGSGFAGLAAAIEAKSTGSRVCIFEKMKAAGGNSAISDGGIAIPGTEQQTLCGIHDSPGLMYDDMLRAGLNLNHPTLVKTLVGRAKQTFEWTVNELGVEYMDKIDLFGGHSAPRCFTAKGRSGATIIRKQVERLKSLGVEIRYQSYFKRFLVDTEGQIAGIIIQTGYEHTNPRVGKDIHIRVKRGIVLATGGFGSDIAFRSAQDPRLSSAVDTTNKPFTNSDAMKQAFGIGALPVQLSCIQLGPWASPDEKGYGVGPFFSEYVVFQHGIIVDPQTGLRVVNELADRKTLSDALLAVGHPCLGLADSRGVEISGWSIDECLKKGIVRAFRSLTELATYYGIPSNELCGAVERYNRSVDNGEDEQFNKSILKESRTIANPPYYGMRLWPKVHYTMGGVGINKHAQVLDLDGKPISRLFAAGEVTGGVHGASRLGSCSITDCLVFGRIAGKNAARS